MIGIGITLLLTRNMKAVFGSCLERQSSVEAYFVLAGEEEALCTKSTERGGDQSRSSERLEQVGA